jgi:hypothetical protein
MGADDIQNSVGQEQVEKDFEHTVAAAGHGVIGAAPR